MRPFMSIGNVLAGINRKQIVYTAAGCLVTENLQTMGKMNFLGAMMRWNSFCIHRW